MVFNSIPYLLFLPTVLGLYWLLSRKGQNALLLAASYLFYGWWDYRFLVFMWFSTLTDYTVGRWLAATSDDRKRKLIFGISLCVNLGILGFFKYFDFFTGSLRHVLEAVGLNADLPTLKLILPVGISFYTFHGISYTFDVYRREIEPERDLLDFACFIAFFPQLVAGPIGRAQIQLPQFANDRQRPSGAEFRSGLFLILLGLFKKVAIADALAQYVNAGYDHSATAGAGQLVISLFAFGLQIYGDFSGYSDIARGSSRLFGIELLRNFEQPFLSRNTTALWRTWHISLSSWLRDYLYVPLGGNRAKRRRVYLNIMIVMLVAGLWHGSKWTFVVWGGLNGLLLVVERVWADRHRVGGVPVAASPIGGDIGTLPIDARHETSVEAQAVRVAHRKEAPLPPPFRPSHAPGALRTFTFFCLTFVFFRAASFGDAARFFRGIVSLRPGPVDFNGVVILILCAAALFTIDIVQRNSRDETPVIDWSLTPRSIVYASLVVAVLIFSGGVPTPFIYFQF
jgi:D-alanyl-lipoteichoic acid acyltransferase DltB (MBOAT superfamily)